MHHLRTRWQYCFVMAMAGLFSAAACAQEVSATKRADQSYPGSPAVAFTAEATHEYPGNPFSRYTQLSQLTGEYSQGASPFFNVADIRPGEGSTAESTSSSPGPSAPVLLPVASSDQLTFRGVTFYGLLDVGATHETHGATYDGNSPQIGVEDLISKNGNHALTHYSEDGLGQSNLGLKGRERLFDGVSLIFRLEPGVELLDMKFTNSVQSLVNNNGVALADQSTNFDTNRSGRVDNGDAYWGFSVDGEQKSASLVYGRVVSLMAENVTKYDFEPGSYAFSLVAYITQVDGGGDSEVLRAAWSQPHRRSRSDRRA
jgi:hypothetical protein